MKHEYKAGGQVRISGKWWPIGEYSGGLFLEKAAGDGGDIGLSCLEQFIEDYRPPKKEPEVYEWMTFARIFNLCDAAGWEANSQRVNQYLTETYGDPTVRTYNGEPAEDFGLEEDSWVLWFFRDRWEELRFSFLSKGDIWRKQPPAPKEETHG